MYKVKRATRCAIESSSTRGNLRSCSMNFAESFFTTNGESFTSLEIGKGEAKLELNRNELNSKPQRPQCSFASIGNTDSWAGRDRAGGNFASGFFDKQLIANQVDAVAAAIDRKSFAEFRGTIRKRTDRFCRNGRFSSATANHFVDAFFGLNRSNENGFGFSFRFCDDIEAEMHAVNEVDISMSASEVHGLRAWSLTSPEGVASGIADSEIRFSFRNSPRESDAVNNVNEPATEKFSGHGFGISLIKSTCQSAHGLRTC